MTSLMAWLVPAAGPGRDQLAATIARLAAEHGTPRFEPHVTMAGLFGARAQEAAATLRALARGVPPFTVTLVEIGGEQAYFRSLFLRAELSPQLVNLHEAASRAWALAAAPYRPHLSLLYSELPGARKPVIARGITIALPLTIRIDAAELWAGGPGNVPGWRRIARVPLTG